MPELTPEQGKTETPQVGPDIDIFQKLLRQSHEGKIENSCIKLSFFLKSHRPPLLCIFDKGY